MSEIKNIFTMERGKLQKYAADLHCNLKKTEKQKDLYFKQRTRLAKGHDRLAEENETQFERITELRHKLDDATTLLKLEQTENKRLRNELQRAIKRGYNVSTPNKITK